MTTNSFEGYAIESAEAEKLREKLKGLLHHEKKLVVIDRIAEFAHGLREKYSAEELHNYEAYCVLAGSTPRHKPEWFDLDGEDSVVRFMESVEREIGEIIEETKEN